MNSPSLLFSTTNNIQNGGNRIRNDENLALPEQHSPSAVVQNDQHQATAAGVAKVQQLLHNFLQNFLGPKAAIGPTPSLPTGLATAALPGLLFPPLAKSGTPFSQPPFFPFAGGIQLSGQQQEQNQARIFGVR